MTLETVILDVVEVFSEPVVVSAFLHACEKSRRPIAIEILKYFIILFLVFDLLKVINLSFIKKKTGQKSGLKIFM